MHCHSYVHDVWPLIKDRKEAGGGNLANMANGPMALDVRTIDARLKEMHRQGIDVHAVSLHNGGGHLPSYVGRSDKCNSWNEACQRMKRKPSDYVKGLKTSGTWWPR